MEREDQRRLPRIPSKNTVLVKSLSEEGLEEFARTSTMGLGGCGFHSDESLGEDTLLEMLISVDQKVVKAKARVVWEQPAQPSGFVIGVEFLQMAPEDQEIIGKLLGTEV